MVGRPVFHVDSWDSDLQPKHHAKPDAVLAEVRRNGRFSTWEMTGTLQGTLNQLAAAGRIVEVPREYPVIQYRAADSTARGDAVASGGRDGT